MPPPTQTATQLATWAAAPSTPNRPAGLNRALLTVFGLLALIAGVYVVLRGVGALSTGALTATGLPAQDPQSTLLPAAVRLPGWVPYVAIFAAVVVGLLCLRWLLAQTGRRTTAGGIWSFPVGHDDNGDHVGHRHGGDTRMHTSAATDALVAEIETYTGVHTARAVISGDWAGPQLHVTLEVTDQALVNELRERIDTTALPRLRQALELDALPTEILIRLGSTTTARVG